MLGIEDQDGWHGKALADKAADAIKVIINNIKNKEGHKLCIQSPVKDAAAVDLTKVHLSEPPSYKPDEMVGRFFFLDQ